MKTADHATTSAPPTVAGCGHTDNNHTDAIIQTDNPSRGMQSLEISPRSASAIGCREVFYPGPDFSANEP